MNHASTVSSECGSSASTPGALLVGAKAKVAVVFLQRLACMLHRQGLLLRAVLTEDPYLAAGARVPLLVNALSLRCEDLILLDCAGSCQQQDTVQALYSGVLLKIRLVSRVACSSMGVAMV